MRTNVLACRAGLADSRSFRSVQDGEINGIAAKNNPTKGNVITLKINDMVTSEVTDNHEGRRAMSGILALQVHAGPPMKVQPKDIRLKTIE